MESVQIVFDCSNEMPEAGLANRSLSHINSERPLISPSRRRSQLSDTPASATELSTKEEYSYQVYAMGVFWVDYFNSLKKCWEPFTEKLVISAQYEKVIVFVCFPFHLSKCFMPFSSLGNEDWV